MIEGASGVTVCRIFVGTVYQFGRSVLRRTPNIDAMTADGMFPNRSAHCSWRECPPSTSELLPIWSGLALA